MMISIAMPFKNSAAFIAETLRSLQAQSYVQWELLAIDDHSSDKSKEILLDFAQDDSRIRVFTNSGQGILPALNQALEIAQGTFFCRLDSDDLWPENHLALFIAQLKISPPRTLVTGLVKYFGASVSVGYRKYQNWLNEVNLQGRQWQAVYRECVIASPNWLMRTAELRDIGGFKGLSYPEDYDLVFRWYAENFRVAVVPELSLYWREHPKRTSRTQPAYQQEAFFALKMNRFQAIEKPQKVALIGWGKKAKLCLKHLAPQVPVRALDLKARISKSGLVIEDFQKVNSLLGYSVLITVFPVEKERKELELALQAKEVSRFWYL